MFLENQLSFINESFIVAMTVFKSGRSQTRFVSFCSKHFFLLTEVHIRLYLSTVVYASIVLMQLVFMEEVVQKF